MANSENRNPAKQLSGDSRGACKHQGAADEKKNLPCDGKTVLVVDDDEICRCVTAEILNHLGMHVHLAPDAEQAIILARTNRYDLILLDLYMPSMNGAELAKILLENGSATEDSTFLLTGEDQDVAVKIMRDGLALRIVRKPLDRAWIESYFSEQKILAQSSDPTAHDVARIDGFDITNAITNFMGNESAFFNILREFPDYGAKFISEYSSYLETKNLKECKRLAHSIKGSSLMIGATEINMLAKELESACFSSFGMQHVETAFRRMEEKILEASENVKKHFLQKEDS